MAESNIISIRVIFAVVRNQPRDGGNYSLSTPASASALRELHTELRNPRADTTALDAAHTLAIDRRAEPTLLHSPATKESAASTSAHLQRAEPRLAAPPEKRIAARVYENPPSVRITESREVEQLNNVQLRRPEEYASVDFVREEARNGGAFTLGAPATKEAQVEVRSWPVVDFALTTPKPLD